MISLNLFVLFTALICNFSFLKDFFCNFAVFFLTNFLSLIHLFSKEIVLFPLVSLFPALL